MSPPHVVLHAAVSLDGATTGFDVDVAAFYALAGTWREDVTLAGADTILAQRDALAAGGAGPGPAPDGPVLAVVDGRERVPDWMWPALRDAGHWRDARPLRAEPGAERVDLRAALGRLGDATVRVDSGGALNGALLAAGLVDEVSLLVHPCLAGPDHRRWHGDAGLPTTALELTACEQRDGGVVWLRHRVRRG